MLNKAIEHKKEKRRPYTSSKRIDPTCRNHGGCPYCEGNRNYHDRKEKDRTNYIMREDLLELL